MCHRTYMSSVGTISNSPPLIALLITSLLIPLGSSLGIRTLLSEPNGDLGALLCLKHHLSNPAGNLSSWKNDSTEFCSWSGVTCSKGRSSHVVALNLDSLNLHGQIPPCIANLTFLERIHVPNNQLNGQIPSEVGQISGLQYLNLSSNNFTGTIPNSLSSCSRLQSIDLASNSLGGSIPEGLGSLVNLSVVSLSGNSLTGRIPVSLGSSSSLVSVVLTNNSLTGSIPFLLANSSSLQELSLGNNQFGGEIPSSLFNSTSLVKLVLLGNNFVGSIPVFSNTDSPLKYLVLQSNKLSGIIPSTLGNFSSLSWLLLGGNNFHGSIPKSIGKIKNLQVLDMTYNILSGEVPASLYNMSELTYLGMGTNILSGEIPGNIGYGLPRLGTLVMQGNNMQGQIPPSLANATDLQIIELRDNSFSGIIPSFATLSNLVKLDLGMNRLEAGDWSFLSSLTNCRLLVNLYLDANALQGILPIYIGNLSNSLEVLLLRENEISGTIPYEIERLKNLQLIYMEKNFLTGNLPNSLGHVPNLFVLSLSQNKLSGKIPLELGNLSQLSELYLQENNLSGSIPGALGDCKNLDKLNLSWNSFNGSIPEQLFTVSSLAEGLDLSHNQLSGPIPLEIGNLINLGPLNISYNKLTGEIPSTLGECAHLESLHMEGNLIDGSIPESFIMLRGIIEMDLSINNLSGEIPEFFESFSSMNLLNLSFNNLEGPVPTGGIFQNEGEVFIQGNKKLCASIPWLQLPLCNVETFKQRRTPNILKILGFTSLSLVLLSCFTFVLLKKRKKKVEQAAQSSWNELKEFSYDDLVKATNNFSFANLIGSGEFGSVYKGALEHEKHAVAIKVFKLDQLGAPRSFLAECETLKNTRHRNLLKVISVCSTCDPAGHEFKALILEFMPNGSLESWLHPKLNQYGLKSPLTLGSRIMIARDIACALDYLHNHCLPPVVHCDLKPSNVLLDDFMGARLADFGLAKFLHGFSYSCHQSSTSLMGPRGTIGYIAPEYGFGGKLSTEGDVYSYGIIILEMITGRRPTDDMFTNDLNLHKFVQEAFPQNISEVLDPCIARNFEDGDRKNHTKDGAKNCIVHFVNLGLLCSMETPKDRPTMQYVYAEVTRIKETLEASRD